MKPLIRICCLILFLLNCNCAKEGFDERDSIIGTYQGVMHFFDENLGMVIDTMYHATYEVTKVGSDQIKFSPPLPIDYSEIENEYFTYSQTNQYADYYSATHSSYRLRIEFDPDSLKLEFKTEFHVGFAYDDSFHKFVGDLQQ